MNIDRRTKDQIGRRSGDGIADQEIRIEIETFRRIRNDHGSRTRDDRIAAATMVTGMSIVSDRINQISRISTSTELHTGNTVEQWK